MPDYAIVIGIDKYTQPGMDLTYPVEQALKMVGWLLNPAGGKVPPQNLLLLLSPSPDLADSRATAAGVSLKRLDALGNLWQANYDRIRAGVPEISRRGAADGDRLFFYCSSHGCRRINFGNEDALVPADYEAGVRNRSPSPPSFALQGGRFREQFFFLDCCRNQAFDEAQLDSVAPAGGPDPPDQPQQFVFTRPVRRCGRWTARMLTDVRWTGWAGPGGRVFVPARRPEVAAIGCSPHPGRLAAWAGMSCAGNPSSRRPDWAGVYRPQQATLVTLLEEAVGAVRA